MAARGVEISADDGTGITVTGNWYFSTALVTLTGITELTGVIFLDDAHDDTQTYRQTGMLVLLLINNINPFHWVT